MHCDGPEPKSTERSKPAFDQEVVTDGNLITSRSPDDLTAFCAAIVETLARSGQAAGSVADS
jgi:putative intracellular protease/amidase